MSKRVRVVHVAPQLDVGGLEKLLVEFARLADRRHFDLHFVSLAGRGALADEIERRGWPITSLNEPTGLRPGLVLRLARCFRRLRPDVVHSHNPRAVVYAAPAARLACVPRVVHTRHGQHVEAPFRQRLLHSLATRAVDRVVNVSADSARFSEREGLPRWKSCTIRNGIDVLRFRYTGPRADGPAVFVGRLATAKAVDVLLEATARAVQAEPSFRLEIAGDGPCRDDLVALADRIGLAGHVRFLGVVSDVPGVLARGSQFVLSSLSEGIPLVALEAMSVGLPVVATSVGGLPEVVEDGETGLLVPPRDPEALARAMLRLYRDPDLCSELGRTARARALALFDVRRMVAEYEDLYLSLLGRPPRRLDDRPPAHASVSHDTRSEALVVR